MVGKALVGRRNNVQIAIKGGFKINGSEYSPDSQPKNLRKSVEGSLRRLQTDFIDLYYIHRIDPNVPIEEVAKTMQELKKEGKILHWGLSEANSETIRRTNNVEPLSTVESEYSMWWREAETTIFPTLEELRIGLVAYSPLGRGFLTGTIKNDMDFSSNDNRKDLPRFQKEAMEANQVVLDFIQELAQEKNATPAQISIAWILAQKPWIVPIPGTTNIKRLKENVEATKITFSDQEKEKMNQALEKIKIVGERYPQVEQERVGK